MSEKNRKNPFDDHENNQHDETEHGMFSYPHHNEEDQDHEDAFDHRQPNRDDCSFLINQALDHLTRQTVATIRLRYLVIVMKKFFKKNISLLVCTFLGLMASAAIFFYYISSKHDYQIETLLYLASFVVTNMVCLGVVRSCVLGVDERKKLSYFSGILPFFAFSFILNLLGIVCMFITSSTMIKIPNFESALLVIGANIVVVSVISAVFLSRFGFIMVTTGIGLSLDMNKLAILSGGLARIVFPIILCVKLIALSCLIGIDMAFKDVTGIIVKSMIFSGYHIFLYLFLGISFRMIYSSLVPYSLKEHTHHGN